MKRNETILVYGVTGLLLVILVVAVVFGSEPGPTAPSPQKVNTLRSLLADDAGTPGAPEVPAGTSGAGGTNASLDGAGPGPVAKTPGTAGDAANKPLADGANGGSAAAPASPPGSVPLVAPSPKPEVLGKSRRERDYRVVTVQRGDTFSGLVEKWCGSLEPLPVALALNETLDRDRLAPGQEVCLPWVDDAVLLEAYEARLAAALLTKQKGGDPARPAVTPPAPRLGSEADAAFEPVGRDPVPELPRPSQVGGPGASEPADGGALTTYTVKSGDSLWAIAARHAGRKQDIPQVIARMRQLNPQIATSDLVRPGTKLKVPKQ